MAASDGGPWCLVLAGVLLAAFLSAGCIETGESKGAPPRTESHAGIGFEHRAPTHSECEIRTNDATYRSEGDTIVLKAAVHIQERTVVEERWSATMHVEWNDWPEHHSLLGGSTGGPPQDKDVRKDWHSGADRADRVQDELRLSWSHDAFSADGEYRASVQITLAKDVETTGGWKPVCRQSGEAAVRVVWG